MIKLLALHNNISLKQIKDRLALTHTTECNLIVTSLVWFAELAVSLS